MTNYECWEIKDGLLEYFDDTHTYLWNGCVVPSITQILKVKFGHKYDGIPKAVLDNAARNGTAVHNAIEKVCKTGEIEDYPEVRNFLFLQKHYKFEVVDNEVPVVLEINGEIVAAGRLDLVLKINNEYGLGDIKRTSALDKEYLAYQLNLYRIAYQQCYGKEIKFLKGFHLRENVRKYVNLPIKEQLALDLVKDFLEGVNNEPNT